MSEFQIFACVIGVWLVGALGISMWWSFEEGRGNYYGDKATTLVWPLAVILVIVTLPFEGMEELGRRYEERRRAKLAAQGPQVERDKSREEGR